MYRLADRAISLVESGLNIPRLAADTRGSNSHPDEGA
jgi:hypothetical protein